MASMAYAVSSAGVTRLTGNVESERQVRVRNEGPNTAWISKDPNVTSGSADAFPVASTTEETVSLASGEALYAICAATQTASVEVI